MVPGNEGHVELSLRDPLLDSSRSPQTQFWWIISVRYKMSYWSTIPAFTSSVSSASTAIVLPEAV